MGSALHGNVLCPPDVKRSIPLAHFATRKVGSLTWQFWEQFELPRYSRNSLLVNLCNLAPLATRGAVTMIHDAQVFITPDSYSGAFRNWYQFALPIIGARASKILTVSEFSKSALVRYKVAPADKIVVIPNGVDHAVAIESDPTCLTRLDLRPGTYAIALATVQKHKNIRILLDAFAHPELSAVKLVLVGSDTRDDFSRCGLVVPPNVTFAGRVSDGGLRALYESASCLLFPSTTEGFGLPPLEAMLAGCPSIVAPCGALPEVCGDAALYASPTAASEWVSQIRSLTSNTDLRSHLVAAGRKRAEGYTWDKSSALLLNVLSGIA
jgi:glycosyltransferase involved in cell wall biosynthesis